jgi:pyruvate dehydrogenase E2 component (dihydrolipoamide acetyltransferase)
MGYLQDMKKNYISFDIRQKIISSSTGLGWTAPHVAYIHEADVTELIIEFNKLNYLKPTDKKIALNTVLIRIMIEGIKSVPAVNGHVYHNKWLASGNIRIMDSIDINIPVLLPDQRMITVKLPDCGNKSLDEISLHINQLMNKLKNTNIDIALLNVGLEDTLKQIIKGNIFRALGRILGLKWGKNKLKSVNKHEKDIYKRISKTLRLCNDDLDIGSITISNLGAAVSGTNGFPALIDLVHPQIMAIGIGPLQEKPKIHNSQIVARKIIPFCIVFDHRALDFGTVAPLIRNIDTVLGKPDVIHEW